jgi:hypothetical protein
MAEWNDIEWNYRDEIEAEIAALPEGKHEIRRIHAPCPICETDAECEHCQHVGDGSWTRAVIGVEIDGQHITYKMDETWRCSKCGPVLVEYKAKDCGCEFPTCTKCGAQIEEEEWMWVAVRRIVQKG